MHSVTKHLYKCGWHGVNIEPLRSKFGLFQRERPRDADLSVAVGDAAAEMRLFECMEESYLSTLDPVIAPGVFDDITYEESDQILELTRLLEESEADRAPGSSRSTS